MKGTAIVGSGIFQGLSGWMLSSVLKEAFNDDLIEMIIGGVYNFSKAAAIDYGRNKKVIKSEFLWHVCEMEKFYLLRKEVR